MFCGLVVLLSVWACQEMAPLSLLVESFSIITQFSFALQCNKMAVPLCICTKEEQHAVICFLWSEGIPGAEIHQRVSAQYGGSANIWDHQ
jgi:hypothetical protein